MLMVQLIALFLVLCFIRSFIKSDNRLISFLISLVAALLFSVQLSSVILTGNIADYRYYENFNLPDVLSVAGFFGKEGALIFLSLTASTLLFHFISKWIQSRGGKKLMIYIPLLAGLFLMCLNEGILNNAYTTLRLKLAGNASFNEALATLQIDESHYISKDALTASRGKNIIVLSLESLEKGYLGEKLRHLTPNLSRLTQEYTFYNMQQSPGSGWTSASMYTAVTGVPALFGLHGNSVFQKSVENKLTTLVDVLKMAGYDLEYFVGRKEFSGIDDMLQSLGFTVKSEKDFTQKYQVVDWGIQDKDLFDEFKKELRARKNSTTPFALFLSTISTHFPNGVPDKRIDSLLPPQNSRLELMVSATDYFVGDLINFLKTEGMLANTVFFIYPDHLLMGKTSHVLEDFEERSLYLITNADRDAITYPDSEDIYQIDIPKIILEGAEIQNNAAFLTDFIKEKDKNAFLRKNDKALLQLNEAALKTLNFRDGIFVEWDKERNIFNIKNSDGYTLVTDRVLRQGSGRRILLEEDIRPVGDVDFDFSRAMPKVTTPYYLDIFWSNEDMFASLKGQHEYGLLKNGKKKIVFSDSDVDLIKDLEFTEDTAIPDDKIRLESNSWDAKKPSHISIGKKGITLSRGLTIVSFNTQTKWEYRTYDTYGSPDDAAAFVQMLQRLQTDKAIFLVLGHDSAAKSLTVFSDDIRGLGFPLLSRLKDRQAYIMYFTDGKINELTDPRSVSVDVPYPKNIKSNIRYFTPPKKEFKPSIDRYIAHAGGSINGVKYTNSKEALDYSYAQGFRLFELDIIETSDGTYVAAHDWNHWAKETGYKGPVPVTLAEFKKHKIRDMYTTMDIQAINQWFGAHPDAILVTDKVNNPANFAGQFVDISRLRMELFSLPALKEASENGIASLIAEVPLSQIKGDKLTYLKKNNIEYVSLSRRNIANKIALLQKFMDNNIKVYIYHVNFDEGKDEQYVFDNEIGLIYGMYADKWIPAFSKSGAQ